MHSACLLCAAVGLVIFPHITNKGGLFVPIMRPRTDAAPLTWT